MELVNKINSTKINSTMINYLYYSSYFISFVLYVKFLYFCTFHLLHKNKNFQDLSLYKKKYVTKNIVKSFNLFISLLVGFPTFIYPAFMYNIWNNHIIYLLGFFYSSNDFAALNYIKDLPKNTRNHHIVTTLISFFSINLDFNTSILGRMVICYAFFSALSLPVNIYLGLRYIYDKKNLVTLKKYTRNIYALSLSLNWTWHIFTSIKNYNTLGISHLIYFFCLFWIIKDDIILMKWLNN